MLVKNPVANNIELELNTLVDETATISILDMNGRNVHSANYQLHSGKQIITLPANLLSSGNIYLVNVTIGNTKHELKVTKD